MKQLGLIHHHVKAFNSEMKHEGLDITVGSSSRGKTDMQLELNDFDLLNNGFRIPHSEFDQGPIRKLFDTVIYRYFEQPKLGETQAKIEAEVSKEEIIPLKGSKIIKAIRKIGNDQEVITFDENPTEEMKQMVNEIIKVKAAADLQLKEQILFCANKLRVGTLDMPKGKDEIHVHTENGTQPLTGKITRKQLIATLWFITKSYMFAPSFRKYLSISVTEGKYTCGYERGVPFFKKDNLTDFECAVIDDLKLLSSEV